MEKIRYNLIRSSLCHIGIVWAEKEKGTKIVRIFLSKDSDSTERRIKRFFPEARQGQNKKASVLSDRIRHYLKGEIACFNLPLIRGNLRSKFQKAVCRGARRIPYGRVATYNGLAKLIGAKSARAVGNALAKNPFPLIIPCHRIVSFDRKIGGFQSGRNLKKGLLKLEGIVFDKEGRIPERFFWGQTPLSPPMLCQKSMTLP